MTETIIMALIQAGPGLLAAAAFLILVFSLRKPLKKKLLPEKTEETMPESTRVGPEMTLIKEELDLAVAERRDLEVSEQDKLSALRRARQVSPVIRGAQILWVDDQHEKNRPLRRILSSLGALIDLASSTDEALSLLKRYEYDLIISDITRGDDDGAGLDMVKQIWEKYLYRWTIFFVENLRAGIPEPAFNITNRPDHLLHLVMDVLERERWT